MDQCSFCQIVKGEMFSYPVYQDSEFLAFLDIRPINPGHLLIIPKQHCQDVFELPPDTYKKLFELAHKLAKPLQKATGAKRIGMAVEGFGVNHAHVHLVPVNGGGELDPRRAQIGKPEELKVWAKKITDALG